MLRTAALLSMLAAFPLSLAARDLSHAAYREKLTALADQLSKAGQAEQADLVRAWGAERDPQCFYPVLVESLAPLVDAAGKPAVPEPFAKLRRQRAEELFAAARDAAAAGHVGHSVQALWDALREDPDHAEARRVLGYQRVDGTWRTKFELEKLRAGQIWHDKFGWIPRDQVERYEQGERFYVGRWITAEREAELRVDMARAWTIHTEHYTVRTNHSLEVGVRLATRLERLHMAWRQLFAPYYISPRQLTEAFARRPLPSVGTGRRQVVYFRDRAEYLRELRAEAAQIDITTGFYLGDKRTAYFFAAEEEDVPTQYHEATHQLFGESRPTADHVGRDGNFWIIEGIACYMESLREENGQWKVGGLDTQRVQAARQRLVDDKFYLPLAELTAMGMLQLQQNPEIRPIYSESTGLTQFLLQAKEGAYRDATILYLQAIYTGRDRPSTLQELTGVAYGDLDREYAGYLGP